MTQPQWHARVDVPSGSRGSGFLVSDRHVLTCAHVVKQYIDVQVTLNDTPTPRPARVLTGATDQAGPEVDVAVLELAERVTVQPACFAPHTSVELYARQRFTAYGFPQRFANSGVNATPFTLSPHRVLGRDIQIDATDDLGVWLQKGFSGAAVVHEATGQVVGMIKQADRGETRIGVMVPVAELARHVPMLNSLIRLGPFTGGEYTTLRTALKSVRAAEDEVKRLISSIRAEVTSLPEHLNTLQAVAEALVVEVDSSGNDETIHRLGNFLWRLPTTRELQQWIDDHLRGSASPTMAHDPIYDGTIVVRLEPAAATGEESYDLTIWTVTDPDGTLNEAVVTDFGLRREQWQERVEDGISEALSRMPVGVETVTVEFVLPRLFLSEPVDQWIDRTDDDTPLGITRPVVVRDLDWFNHTNPAVLGRQARNLRDTGLSLGELLRWRDCKQVPGNPTAFKAWLRTGEGPLVISLAGHWAAAEHVSTAVAAGPPVLIWRRPPCMDDHRSDTKCTGRRFRHDLTEQLRDTTVDTVAQRIRDLRAHAAAKEDETHCGGGITLLRDDTRRRPTPLSFAK
ncbi:trypsin-like peptidase domain-containing protein [Micromonospora echinospora]|uniref:VMAP-C domain-containing protein n=1 Tax=Micromonospora echinospora TaxID=1877 RepID=UPI003A8B8A6A